MYIVLTHERGIAMVINEEKTIKAYEKIQKLYLMYRDIISKTTNTQPDIIDMHLTPNCDYSDKSIFKRLCASLQNSGHMSNTINFEKDYLQHDAGRNHRRAR